MSVFVVGVKVFLLEIFFWLSTKKQVAEMIGLPEPSWIKAIYQPSSDFSV